MKFIASGLAAATLASAASADITITLNNQSFAGFNFNTIMNYAGGQNAVGTLTGAVINMTLNASTSFTYADDICIYVGPSPINVGGRLQIGGYSNLNAQQRRFWPTGGSSAPGTTATGSVTLATPLTFVGNTAVDQFIYIGNGYGAQGTSGTWTGTITLIGINEVPAPGAVALLGLAGLSARRRRR